MLSPSPWVAEEHQIETPTESVEDRFGVRFAPFLPAADELLEPVPAEDHGPAS
jgi:hypothetical protein